VAEGEENMNDRRASLALVIFGAALVFGTLVSTVDSVRLHRRVGKLEAEIADVRSEAWLRRPHPALRVDTRLVRPEPRCRPIRLRGPNGEDEGVIQLFWVELVTSEAW
jgi:hypothetical protein